jgi:integrase
MATEKVGVYRNYHGAVPRDSSGKMLPKSQWPRRRAHSWVVRWFGSKGQRYSKSFKTRKEAYRFAEKKQKKVRDGKADLPPQISLREFYKEHRQLMAGNVAPKTLQLHLAAVELLAESLGWDKPVHRISVRDVERFRADRLETGISPASANREVKTLKRIFNLAAMRGYLSREDNPCVAIPMLRVASKRPPYINPEDFHGMYRCAPDVLWRTFLVTVYTTGLRLREATNLTWHDIDFEAGEVHITRKSASGWVQAWTPKDHEMRTIPLPRQAINLLTAWQAMAPEECPYVFMEHGRWAFYRQKVEDGSWRTGQDLVNNSLRKFKTICRHAGVGPYTIHDLRRSCITNWSKRGLPIHVVQQLAGHSDIKTTQQFYLSVGQDDVNRAQAIQASLLGEIPVVDPTDQILTKSGQKRRFPGRQGCQAKREALD